MFRGLGFQGLGFRPLGFNSRFRGKELRVKGFGFCVRTWNEVVVEGPRLIDRDLENMIVH